MLSPKNPKWRRAHRGRRKGVASRGNTVAFGDFGIQALSPAWVTARQIEAARVAVTRHVKRGGKLWIRVFPDKPVSKKPLETRMGGGKAPPEFWVAVVQRGRVLFELAGVPAETAKEALRLAQAKLPCRTRILERAR